MTYHCPKCGEVCRELIFDFRDHIIACDVCEKRQTRFKLEEDNYGRQEVALMENLEVEIDAFTAAFIEEGYLKEDNNDGDQ